MKTKHIVGIFLLVLVFSLLTVPVLGLVSEGGECKKSSECEADLSCADGRCYDTWSGAWLTALAAEYLPAFFFMVLMFLLFIALGTPIFKKALGDEYDRMKWLPIVMSIALSLGSTYSISKWKTGWSLWKAIFKWGLPAFAGAVLILVLLGYVYYALAIKRAGAIKSIEHKAELIRKEGDVHRARAERLEGKMQALDAEKEIRERFGGRLHRLAVFLGKDDTKKGEIEGVVSDLLGVAKEAKNIHYRLYKKYTGILTRLIKEVVTLKNGTIAKTDFSEARDEAVKTRDALSKAEGDSKTLQAKEMRILDDIQQKLDSVGLTERGSELLTTIKKGAETIVKQLGVVATEIASFDAVIDDAIGKPNIAGLRFEMGKIQFTKSGVVIPNIKKTAAVVVNNTKDLIRELKSTKDLIKDYSKDTKKLEEKQAELQDEITEMQEKILKKDWEIYAKAKKYNEEAAKGAAKKQELENMKTMLEAGIAQIDSPFITDLQRARQAAENDGNAAGVAVADAEIDRLLERKVQYTNILNDINHALQNFASTTPLSMPAQPTTPPPPPPAP